MLRKQKSIDSFCQKNETREFSDYGLAKFIQKNKKSSVLFAKQGRMEKFSTESLNFHYIKSANQPNFQSLDGFLSYKKIQKLKQTRKSQRDLYLEIQDLHNL